MVGILASLFLTDPGLGIKWSRGGETGIPGQSSEPSLFEAAHKLHIEFTNVKSIDVLAVQIDHVAVRNAPLCPVIAEHLERAWNGAVLAAEQEETP